MPRLAFSTVATHDWTLDRVLNYADRSDFDGVELRTFGSASTRFACDPALTDAAKIRRLSAGDGVTICTIATGLTFDQKVHPPVIGRVVGDWEAPLREAKRAIDLAEALACPFVRVFAFETEGDEKRARAMHRICARLRQVLDAARNTSVRIVLENGGSFPTAADLAEVMDEVNHPLLGASYSASVARLAGEDPIAGVNVLGDRLWMAKVKDHDQAGRPCPLGEGAAPCEAFVGELARNLPDAWIVFEWDRAWIDGLAPAEEVLPHAAARLAAWSTVRAGRAARRRGAPVMPRV